MTVDLDKMLENIELFGADSMEYKLNYRKDGTLYQIRLNIEEVDEDNE